MGIPAAPDVANLYMSYFEDSFANEFPLYKRCIDDVFCLVEADSKKSIFRAMRQSPRGRPHAHMVSGGESRQLS